MTYSEPLVSFLVLDFEKRDFSRLCLESIRNRTKFEHKIIYLHNGPADYPAEFLEEGLIDQLIQTKKNNGLGVGTRDLFAASFSRYSIYWQNDQVMGRDFELSELEGVAAQLADSETKSISLAGRICGEGIYSERAHLIKTEYYRFMENTLGLSYGGAGPYHHIMWREEQIQKFYAKNGYRHRTDWPVLADDNGRTAERQNPDGSRWRHYPDTKQLWLLNGPVKERFVYPKFSEREWDFVLTSQVWPAGEIPENEKKDSFHVWN